MDRHAKDPMDVAWKAPGFGVGRGTRRDRSPVFRRSSGVGWVGNKMGKDLLCPSSPLTPRRTNSNGRGGGVVGRETDEEDRDRRGYGVGV